MTSLKKRLRVLCVLCGGAFLSVLLSGCGYALAGRGKYDIVPDANAVDAVLTGDITAVSITPASINANQLASRYAITMVARVELRDKKTDMVLWDNPSLVFRQEYDATGTGTAGAVDPSAFFGQSTDALERLSTDFAKSIVSAILEAF